MVNKPRQITRCSASRQIPLLSTVLVLTIFLPATLPSLLDAQQQPGPAAIPEGARPLVVEIDSLIGRATYSRKQAGRTRIRRLSRRSRLQQGDTLHLDVGARCQLVFRLAAPAAAEKKQAVRVLDAIQPVAFAPEAPQPEDEDVVAAVVLLGYSELTVARAYQQGQSTQTQLDMKQGIIRAGIVKTPIPPTFRIRTPRTVVAVRGTEIRELEASIDRGDLLSMGRTGVVAANDRALMTRSAQAQQGTRKPAERGQRSGQLVRTINDMIRRTRVVLNGPHRGRIELLRTLQEPRDATGFSRAEKLKPNGNPQFQQFLNSSSNNGTSNSFSNDNDHDHDHEHDE